MLTFSYDTEKDAENIIKASRSVNNPKPTEIQKMFIARYGEVFDEGKVKAFIQIYLQDYEIDTDDSVKAIKEKWRKIEDTFIKRANEIFNLDYAYIPINVFLTIDDRCTYNIKEKYFFARITGKESNRTIMHELLHFYTWDKFGNRGIESKLYNDIKESFTELLNIEFVDLMDGAVDKGYSQHQEMREKVRKLWSESKDVEKVFDGLIGQ